MLKVSINCIQLYYIYKLKGSSALANISDAVPSFENVPEMVKIEEGETLTLEFDIVSENKPAVSLYYIYKY